MDGAVEFNEGYIEKATSKHLKLKRGRGSQRQAQAVLMAESTSLEDIETGVRSKHCRHFKIKVFEDHHSNTLTEVVKENFNQKNIVFSDKRTNYVGIAKLVEI